MVLARKARYLFQKAVALTANDGTGKGTEALTGKSKLVALVVVILSAHIYRIKWITCRLV